MTFLVMFFIRVSSEETHQLLSYFSSVDDAFDWIKDIKHVYDDVDTSYHIYKEICNGQL